MMTTWPDKGEHRWYDERVGNNQKKKKKENKETEEDEEMEENEETEGCEFKGIKEVFIMA